MKINFYTGLSCIIFIGLSSSHAIRGSQTSSNTGSHNDTNGQLVSFFDVVKSFIEEIRDEKNEAKRVELCTTTIRLISSWEKTSADPDAFGESLKIVYEEWVRTRKPLSQRAEHTEGLILPQDLAHQSLYLGLSQGKNIYFRDILHHLETEFLKKSWGRPILVGIQGGAWYRKSTNAENLLTEESIMSSWMIFLEEMTNELNRIEKLIRSQLNNTAQIVTRVEVAESRELFATIQSFIKLCAFLHKQAADRKIKEAYRKQYSAIMNTPEDSEIIRAYREIIAAELRNQENDYEK